MELSPDNYKNLPVNRPNEVATVNAAVCNTRQQLHVVSNRGAVSDVYEFASPQFRAQWWKGIDSPDQLPTVECMPLVDILDQHMPANDKVIVDDGVHDDSTTTTSLSSQPVGRRYFFDFFSLDVEGGELGVLQSIDWDRTAFGIIIMEGPLEHDLSGDAKMALLVKNGYIHLGWIRGNHWYINQDFHEIYKDIL